MSPMASQITGISIVYSTVCLDAGERKYQSCASLAFVRGIQQRGKCFHLMMSSCGNITRGGTNPVTVEKILMEFSHHQGSAKES